MSDAAKLVRRSKRDVIVIDDEQPAEKSVKREEEPVSPPEVLELMQKLDKTEEQLKVASRAARAAELRAEAAENRLDSKNGIKEDFHAEKKRVDDLEARLAASTQMEEGRRRADTSMILELATEKEALKAELAAVKQSHKELAAENRALKAEVAAANKLQQASLNQATTLLDDWKRKLSEIEKEKNALKNALTKKEKESEEKEKKLSTMTVERDVERDDARDTQARDRARIDELSQKLAHYESVLQPIWQLQQQPQQLQQPLPATMPRPAGVAPPALKIATPDEVEMNPKSGHPLANADLTEKLLDLVQKALNCDQLTSGVQAVEASLNFGNSEMLILAADSKNASVRHGLPTLCEEKSVPFIFVPSASHLGRAAGFSGERRVAVAIDKLDGSGIEQQIREMKEEVEKLH